MTEQRRLAAILVADVVGYSKLVGSDEAGTLAQLQALRTDVIEPQIAKHAGRLFKSVGDGFLVEFASAVQAVGCAKAIQESNAIGRLLLRIGIHVGDVVVQGDDLMGDGVNVAARIEGVAEPGAIALSRAVHEQVRDKLDLSFIDRGEIELKNIARPVQVFVVEGVKGAAAPTTLPLPDKPSIAVLPFQNMSGDPEQEYFADGVVEDIITALSRFKSLFVIARNSSFTYKGKAVDIRHVGRELGVHYVLEGSIRKSSNRIRVTGQLVDTLSGNHIWAERYDRVLEDVFAVQEEVTQAIVAAIAPQIEAVEQSKAARRRPDNLNAYEIGLLAWAHAWQGYATADGALLDQAVREARDALAIDPRSALALHAIAYARAQSLPMLVRDREPAFREAMWAAARAIELDSTDALGYALRALCVLSTYHVDHYPEALTDAQRAHEMNSNDAFVLACLAWLEAIMGDHERAIEHAHQILRLSPRDARSCANYHLLGVANFVGKHYSEGIRWASRALNDRPEMFQARFNLVNCYVGANDIAKAHAVFVEGRGRAPDAFKTRLERGATLYSRPEDNKRANVFFRIAAGLEDPSAAEALR